MFEDKFLSNFAIEYWSFHNTAVGNNDCLCIEIVGTPNMSSVSSMKQN
jgi:hypothetical protein